MARRKLGHRYFWVFVPAVLSFSLPISIQPANTAKIVPAEFIGPIIKAMPDESAVHGP
jgi:hypothetical protein